jgi:hypothetical protein
VGSAIAASSAAAGAAEIALCDVSQAAMESLADRLGQSYPKLKVTTGSNDPNGFDVVINATPLGMKAGDPMPVDVSRLSPSTYVGEVVMKQETTAFLAAARAKGCEIQIGIDMLFEQIPAYLEFFGFPSNDAFGAKRGRRDRLLEAAITKNREEPMTAAIAHEPRGRRQTKIAAASGWMGSALEYYDFFVYATAASLVFPQIFFPSTNPTVAIPLWRPTESDMSRDRSGRSCSAIGATLTAARTCSFSALSSWASRRWRLV